MKTLRRFLFAALAIVAAAGLAVAGGVSSLPVGSLSFDQAFGSTVGALLCRASAGWATLAAGSAGQVLTVPSGGGCPAWATPASGGNVSNTGTPAAGQIAAFTNATTIQGVSTVPVSAGGTGAATASSAQVFAGPTSGSAAAPGFRALVTADMPASVATSGANSNITSLTGLTTPLAVAEGGRGDTGGAWASFTPTITFSGGSGTSVSNVTGSYRLRGKDEKFHVSFQVSYSSAPTSINVYTPNGTCQGANVLPAFNQSSGYSLAAFCTNQVYFMLTKYDGSSPVSSSGSYVTVGGTLEIQ